MKSDWRKRSKVFRVSLCMMLALAMTITVFPLSKLNVYAAGGGESKLTDANSVFALDTQKPKEMDQLPENVYDAGQDQPFLLSEQNELAIITTNNGNADMYRLDNLDMEAYYSDNSNYDTLIYGPNVANAESSSKLGNSDMGQYNSLDGLQSVSLDWDGTGRREYIASVGFLEGGTTAAYNIMLQNASTGEYVIPVGTYVGFALGQQKAPFWARDNYLAITAGDYDGDGCDSIIVFSCGAEWTSKAIRLVEISKNGSGYSFKNIYDMAPVFRDTGFLDDMEYKTKPTISLATGDFNGDGRDQLAWAAGFYNNSNNVRDGFKDYACDNIEQFATVVGVLDNESGSWSSSKPVYLYDKGARTTLIDGEETYPLTIMHAGQIAAGDLNNDGIDEIVAAGYLSLIKDESPNNYARAIYKNGKLTKVSHVCDWSPQYLASSVIYYTPKGYKKTELEPFKMKEAFRAPFNDYCKDEDWAHAKVAIACGKLNGDNSPEYVFISGAVYDFENYTPDEKYAPYWMNNDLKYVIDTSSDPVVSSVNWVRNVTAGNFSGNNAGREQFVFTFWQKHYGENQYAATIGSIAGVDFDDKTDKDDNIISYGAPKQYANGWYIDDCMWGLDEISRPDYNKASGLFSHAVPNDDNRLNGVPVAVDIDDDGVLGKFSKKGYVYTDPEVLAVLQAGPFFKEIADSGGYEDPCETSYSISTGYRTGTSRTDDFGFEVGFAGEASGPGVKVALEAGYSQDWSHTFEENYTVTSTVTYTAQSHDAVVISRIPVIIYTYDLYDKDNNSWIRNGYNVRVPLSPRFCLLSIKEYNKFVDEYNKIIGDGEFKGYQLYKIIEGEDMPENHEGNPAAYWGNWAQAGEGHKGLSKSDVGLSYASGHTACEYTTEAEKTESKETSYGVHFGLTLQTGSDYAVGDAWAGAYTNVDYKSTTGESTSSIDTTSSGGQVQNIDMDALKDAGYREDLIRQYYFKWQFGKWTRQLMQDGAAVPFYGYAISEVSMPASGLILELDYLYEKGDLKVSLPANSFEQTGSAIEVKPVVRFDDKTLKEGRDYTLSYANNIDPGVGVITITGTGKYVGSVAVEFTIGTAGQDAEAEKAALKEKEASIGDAVKVSNNAYKVTSVNKKTVAFTKAKNVKSVSVPASIKINGEVYKVTEIGAKAFKGKKIRSVTIGKNVKKIKAKAFDGSKATKLILKTKLLKKSAVKNSLKGSRISTIKVSISKKLNKKYAKKYKKYFTKANAGKKVTVK